MASPALQGSRRGDLIADDPEASGTVLTVRELMSHSDSDPIQLANDSEKYDAAPDVVAGEGCGDASGAVTATVLTYGYHARPEPLKAIIRAAKSVKALRLMTRGRLYLENALLDRLAQDLQDMAAELGPCIQEEHAIVG